MRYDMTLEEIELEEEKIRKEMLDLKQSLALTFRFYETKNSDNYEKLRERYITLKKRKAELATMRYKIINRR